LQNNTISNKYKHKFKQFWSAQIVYFFTKKSWKKVTFWPKKLYELVWKQLLDKYNWMQFWLFKFKNKKLFSQKNSNFRGDQNYLASQFNPKQKLKQCYTILEIQFFNLKLVCSYLNKRKTFPKLFFTKNSTHFNTHTILNHFG